MWTGNPITQSKIEPVSDLRLHKFGNIAETARRFSAEIWARREILESRSRSRHKELSEAPAQYASGPKHALYPAIWCEPDGRNKHIDGERG